MNYCNYKDVYEEDLEQTNQEIERVAEELGLSECRVTNLIVIHLLTNILHDLQHQDFVKQYKSATSVEQKDNIISKYSKNWT